MKDIRIFYSWQSDIKGKFNRYFIEECLNSALKNLHKEKEISVDFIVDRDTANKEGTPDIVNTIFEKIDNSEIFIGDISIVNQSSSARKTPNPNVLIELGYAAGKLDWNRIICVFNLAYGDIEDLPFDIKTKRILTFKFDETLDKKEVQRSLVKTFEYAIKAIDLKEIEFKRQVLEEFKTENQEIINVVLKRGDYWEFKLIGKLLEKGFEKIEYQLEELEKGLTFRRTQKLDIPEYLDWSSSSLNYIMSLTNSLNILSRELTDAIGVPGESGDPFRIRKVVRKLFEIFEEVIRWEVELKAIKTSNKILKLKELMCGWSRELINQFHHLPEEFRKIYEGEYPDGSTININITLTPFDSIDQLFNTLSFYNQNIHLFLEEE